MNYSDDDELMEVRKNNIDDFTTENYSKLVRLAKKRFKFCFYSNFKSHGRFILWRHDVDFSPHRAMRLAKLEQEEGVIATYFIHLQSQFYNIFEPEVTRLIRNIISCGHALGLHFDIADRNISSIEHIEKELKADCSILEHLFEVKIQTFSFHNPTLLSFPVPGDFEIGNMVNAYSDYFKTSVRYCSDSNGYWRFERLEDVILAPSELPLQVLTHPGWWLDDAMMPRQRIQRCIDGRAQKVAADYDRILAIGKRMNLS